MILHHRYGVRSDGDYDYDLYALKCDRCGRSVEEHSNRHFYTFNEAKNYGKKNGWKLRKINNKWRNICPKCQNRGD